MKRIAFRRPTGMVALVALLVATAPGLAFARQATPVAEGPVAGITLAASGLTNPRGLAWDAGGDLLVALAGVGGTNPSGGDTPQERANGRYFGGPMGSVVRIEGGCPVTVAGGLPSTRGSTGHDQGPSGLAFLDGQLYVLEDGGGRVHGNPDNPNGLYAVEPDGGIRLVADIGAWVQANPVANVPYDLDPLGEPFGLVAGGDALWVLESNSGQLLRVTPDGAITRLADLSAGHPVPAGFALAPDGGFYVGFLTPTPFLDGSSKIVRVGADGSTTDVWTGLTAVTGVAVAPDGTLYALEMATGNTTTPPFILPGTGRVVRQTGPASAADVATGLDFPIALAFGPDGGLYVSSPAFGADGPTGVVVRVDVAAAGPIALPDDLVASSPCAVASPVASPAAPPVPPAAPPASPAAPPAAPVAATPATGTPLANDGGKPSGALAVHIQNFAFSPSPLEVPAGTTVTWTNLDGVPHTATATGGAFDSGNLAPGQAFSFTFDTPGSYAYACQYHPGMQGTIVVQ